MNVIIYCRVSSDEQAEGTSLDVQEERLTRYCDRKGYNIINIPHREDASGKTFKKRPIIQGIMSYIRKNKGHVDKLLVLRWNRYSRDLPTAMANLVELQELKVEVNSIEEPINYKSTQWPHMLGAYIGIAHSDNLSRSHATLDGIHGTLLRGKCSNKAPRGYINVRTGKHETSVEVDEVKAKIISQVFQEVAKGVEAPNSIRRRLCPNIQKDAFYRMLRNIFYTGQVRVPPYEDEPEQIVKGQHQAIIDIDTFDKVQEILSGKRKSEPRLSKAIDPDLYLRKFLVCPICGYSMTGATSTGAAGGKYKYYNCCHDGKHLRKPADYVNNKFADWVGGLRPNKEVLELYREVLQDIRGEHKQDVQKEIETLRKDIEKIETLRDKADDKFCEGALDADSYARITKRHGGQIKILQERITLLQADTKELKEKVDYSMNVIANLGNFMKNAPVKVKCKILSSMFPKKIQFDGEKYRTTDYNQVLDLIFQETNKLRGYGEKECEKPAEVSHSVPRPRIELGTKS